MIKFNPFCTRVAAKFWVYSTIGQILGTGVPERLLRLGMLTNFSSALEMIKFGARNSKKPSWNKFWIHSGNGQI